MKTSENEFRALMQEMVRVEGQKLLEEEKRWRDRVPESTDRAAGAALSSVAVGAGAWRGGGSAAPRGTARPAGGAATGAAKKAAVSAAAALLAAGAVLAVSCGVSPSVREAVFGPLEGAALRRSEGNAVLSPEDYTIPSPGEAFTVTDAVSGKGLAYCWFTSDRQEVLVEIAPELPPDNAAEEELVLIGMLPWTYYESGESKFLQLRDGGMDIRIVFFNAEREEVLAYAGLLLAANGK